MEFNSPYNQFVTTLYSQYSQLTLDITKKLSKDEKKTGGIFITPNVIINKLFESIEEHITEHNIEIKHILEPACGTCEIVNYCDNRFTNVNITAIELNDTIYNSIDKLKFKNTVDLIHGDFMEYKNVDKYDLIVTNPPYFVCKKDYFIQPDYKKYIQGRANIFGLFIIHSLSMIRPNGILAFIVPKSFLNSIYYSKIRNYIKKTCEIVEIIDFEKDNEFIDTEQATFGIVLKKNSSEFILCTECDYSIKINDNYMFTNDSLILKNIFYGSTTIEKMGLKVRTGSIVWNEHKNELTNDKDKTVLLYNSNITSKNTIELKDFEEITKKRHENKKNNKNNKDDIQITEEKRQYIDIDGRIEPVMVVNRGNGNSKYKLNYAVVTFGPYLIENHLNEIYSPKQMEKKELLKIFDILINSFKNEKTQLFINLFLGNNGLSKTELETIFPIYL